MKWIKTGKEVKGSGESTVYYESIGGRFEIQSRKKAIPHANGVGYWMHTTYFLIHDGKKEEYDLLCRAKEAAENLLREEHEKWQQNVDPAGRKSSGSR